MYKVLKEVAEDTSKGKLMETSEPRLQTTLRATSEAKLGGRVKDTNARKMLAKQLGEFGNEFANFDLSTGQVKQRKAKKEQSPEQLAMKDLKTLFKKQLDCKFVFSPFLSFHGSFLMVCVLQGGWPTEWGDLRPS